MWGGRWKSERCSCRIRRSLVRDVSGHLKGADAPKDGVLKAPAQRVWQAMLNQISCKEAKKDSKVGKWFRDVLELAEA